MTPPISTAVRWPVRVCEYCTWVRTRRAPTCGLEACPKTTIRIGSAREYLSLCQRQRHQHERAVELEPALKSKSKPRRRAAGSGLTRPEISRLGATVRWQKWRAKYYSIRSHRHPLD